MTAHVTPVFLLSLPRSGSTLVQRVLATDPSVATTGEPWVALAPLLASERDGITGIHDHDTLVDAVAAFRAAQPDGESAYDRAVGAFLRELYGAAAQAGSEVDGTAPRWFVDKTPRYSLVADRLLRAVPEAPAIVLWRNPLAVVASMTATWHDSRWFPNRHGVDLFTGLARLVAVVTADPGRVTAVRYEDLLVDRAAWDPVLRRLDLDLPDEAFSTVPTVGASGPVGDPTQDRYAGISTAPLDKWRDELASPVRVRWCRRYLDWIGAERLAVMGYDLERLHADLDGVEVRATRAVPDVWASLRERGRSAVRGWQAGRSSLTEWSPGRVPW